MPKVAGPRAREQESQMKSEQKFFDNIDRKSALASSGLPTFQAPESGFKGFEDFDFSAGDSIFESDLPAAGSDVPAFGNFFTDTLSGMESEVTSFGKGDGVSPRTPREGKKSLEEIRAMMPRSGPVQPSTTNSSRLLRTAVGRVDLDDQNNLEILRSEGDDEVTRYRPIFEEYISQGGINEIYNDSGDPNCCRDVKSIKEDYVAYFGTDAEEDKIYNTYLKNNSLNSEADCLEFIKGLNLYLDGMFSMVESEDFEGPLIMKSRGTYVFQEGGARITKENLIKLLRWLWVLTKRSAGCLILSSAVMKAKALLPILVAKIPCQTFLAVANTTLSKATAAGVAAPGLSSVGVATFGTVGFITFILGMSIAAGITLFKATRRTPLNAVEEAQLNKARNDVIMNAASIQLATTGQLMLKDLEHRKKMVDLLKSCVTLKSQIQTLEGGEAWHSVEKIIQKIREIDGFFDYGCRFIELGMSAVDFIADTPEDFIEILTKIRSTSDPETKIEYFGELKEKTLLFIFFSTFLPGDVGAVSSMVAAGGGSTIIGRKLIGWVKTITRSDLVKATATAGSGILMKTKKLITELRSLHLESQKRNEEERDQILSGIVSTLEEIGDEKEEQVLDFGRKMVSADTTIDNEEARTTAAAQTITTLVDPDDDVEDEPAAEMGQKKFRKKTKRKKSKRKKSKRRKSKRKSKRKKSKRKKSKRLSRKLK